MTLSPALQAARSEFIKSPEGVGYNSSVESLRDSEYPQLKGQYRSFPPNSAF